MKKHERITAAAIGVSIVLLLYAAEQGPLSTIDSHLYDYAFHLREPLFPGNDIVIVGIDEESFQKSDIPFVLWNGEFASVLKHISGAGAKVIGFDIIQTKPYNRLIAEDNLKLLKTIEDIGSSGETGLVFSYIPSLELYPFFELQMMLLEYDGLGYANLTLDNDQVVRRHELYVRNGDMLIPSFPLLLTAKYLGITSEELMEHPLRGSATSGAGIPERIMNIDFHEPFRRLSFSDVLEKIKENDRAYFSENFSGRIVLMGTVTTDDMALVAYSGRSRESNLMPGVEIHANIIHTLISGDYISEIDPFAYFLVPALFSAIILCLVYMWISFYWGFGITAVLCMIFFLIWKYLFGMQVYLNFAVPVSLIFLSFVSVNSYKYTVESSEKRKIRRIFKSYVNESVLNDLLEKKDPSIFSMKRGSIVLLFSDVRNFTTLSEPLAPDVIARQLNEYMTAMCNAIFEHRGTVNKFIGDGIMAMWGAPVEDPNGCLHAVQAALKMMKYLEELNAGWVGRGCPEFNIGVGIHFANVAVGYLGHPDRMEYTALGDGVNTASRVESLNKHLKTNILVTEAVYNQISDAIVVGLSSVAAVKGRSDVKVYEVKGMKGAV